MKFINQKIEFKILLFLIVFASIPGFYTLRTSGIIDSNFPTIQSISSTNVDDNIPMSTQSLYYDVTKKANILDNHVFESLFQDDVLYVATNFGGLGIVDVSDPTNPVEIGRYDDDRIIESVDVKDGIAYLADYGYGGMLNIVNISDLTNPFLISQWSAGDSLSCVRIIDSYAYLAEYHYGLKVVNVTDPSTPNLVTSFEIHNGKALNIFVSGNYLYLGAYGVYVYDISDPGAPTYVNYFSTSGSCYDLYVKDNLVYIAGLSAGIAIYNVTDPYNPSHVWSYSGGVSRGIYVNDTIAFFTGSQGYISRYDVSNASATTLLNSFNVAGGSPWDIIVDSKYVYVSDLYLGLQIIDYTSPLSPVIVGEILFGGRSSKVTVHDDYAYVSDAFQEMYLVNVSDNNNPKLMGSYYNGHVNDRVVINDSYLFSCGDDFVTFDNSNPLNPQVLNTYDAPSSISDAYVVKDLVYLACYHSGLIILNMSNPNLPVLVNQYDNSSNVKGIYVKGDYAFLADYGRGLEVLDISDPYHPVYVNRYSNTSYFCSIKGEGNYVYLCSWYGGLDIFDITDPINVSHVGTCERTMTNTFDIFIDGNFAYLADDLNGILVVNITDPASPYEIGSSPYTGAGARGVYVVGEFIYEAAYGNGLMISTLEIDHTPPELYNLDQSPSSPDEDDIVTIDVITRDYSGIAEVKINYRIDGGSWQEGSMYHDEYDFYVGTFGPFVGDSLVEYFISSIDDSTNSNEAILDNDGMYYNFTVIKHPDYNGPSISNTTHSPSTPIISDTITISANIEDKSGIQFAEVYYTPPSSSFVHINMTHVSGTLYEAIIGSFSEGDVYYYIKATDNSENHNYALDTNWGSYYMFTVATSIHEFSKTILLIPFVAAIILVIKKRKFKI